MCTKYQHALIQLFLSLNILKENGGTHRCVFASITVKAPVREVWNVLTAYEELPEYNVLSFSNLVSSLSSFYEIIKFIV